MIIRKCHNKIMDMEMILDTDYDPEEMIINFTCSHCQSGITISWEELCGDVIRIEEGALERLRKENLT